MAFAPYNDLVARAHEVALLDGTANLLDWDQETWMPLKAASTRADQLAFLRGWSHRLLTEPAIDGLLKICEDHGFAAQSIEGTNVREWRRDYDRQAKLPQKLVEDFERTSSLARAAWGEARAKSEFGIFRPHLQKMLELTREKAEHWGYDDCVYDALLEWYEPGMRTSEIKRLFAKLRPAIVELSKQAERSDFTRKSLEGYYPISAQKAFNRKVVEAIGFDFEAGRIDTTRHPFTLSLGREDCRVTTRYDETDFTVSLYALLHEAGHGLYEQGLPVDRYGTPLGEPVSLGIHESQSRLWENKIGRTVAFWDHWFPIAKSYFPEVARLSPESITKAVNHVSPSFIRLEADEVTYDLHIILRFELELRLVEGDLDVADIPAAWNEEFEKLFGLRVPNDAQGCLQDIHWSLGSFGYFPTYTLGNLNSAQLFAKAREECPAIDPELREGNYNLLLDWLREKIHSQGRRYAPQKLMKFATGESTQIHYQIDHLRRKILDPLMDTKKTVKASSREEQNYVSSAPERVRTR
jgi:carboxypeptidase Taq